MNRDKCITKTVSGTGTWAASATLPGIELPNDGIITEIRVRAHIVSTAALAAATTLQDGPRKHLQGLTIKGGGRNFLSLSGGLVLGRMLALINFYDYGVSNVDQVILAATTTTTDTTYVFHPGSDKNNRWDLSAGIPAKAIGSVQAIIECPAAAIPDTNTTIASGTYYIEVDEVIDTPVPAAMMIPNMYSQVMPHTASIAGYGFQTPVPSGNYLRRIPIMVTEHAATPFIRSDAPVGGFIVNLPKKAMRVIESNWNDLKFSSARFYGVQTAPMDGTLGAEITSSIAHLPLGFAIIDFRRRYNSPWGMNLITDESGNTVQNGDVVLGETTLAYGAGDATTFFWDMLQPCDPKWIGK